jgi:transposase
VVSQYISDFKASGLTFEDIDKMDDESFLQVISGNKRTESERFRKLSESFPDYSVKLSKVGGTLKNIWADYIKQDPSGYSYGQFCYHYQVWRDSLEISMHMEHKAGDKMFVDFTGKKLQITDRLTGCKMDVETFVAILGASQLTFVTVCESQKKEDFIRATQDALIYFGGVPLAIVPDCLKSGIDKYDRYEPDINPDYADFARHYGTTILPARSRHPRDKALVENAVGIVYSWIYYALSERTFYSIEELKQAVKEELEKYNSKPMQKLKRSRRDIFLEIEKNVLRPLPEERYQFKKFSKATAQLNYHVYLSEDKHYYSVPHTYKGKRMDIIYTESTVEIFYQHFRIASHKRDRRINGYTTVKEHMPPNHRFMDNLNPDRLLRWGQNLGTSVGRIIEKVLATKEHPEQGYKVSLGILKLEKKYGKVRLDNACRRALSYGIYSYKRIKLILDSNLDLPIGEDDNTLFAKLPEHRNIRGNEYYH